MTFTDYFLLSIFYFWASSTSISLGVGYYTIYRPVMAGMIAGLILKDPQKGMMAGAVVNIIYIDFVSTGGSLRGDPCLTAIVAAAASILYDLHPLEAAAIAYPFGLLGTLIWKYRLKINNIFVHIYEKRYNDNKDPDISVYDGLLPQLLLLIMSSVVFIAAVFLMFLLNNAINLKYMGGLYYIGLILVILSAFNILHKIKNKYNYIIFGATFLAGELFDIRAYILFVLICLTLLLIIDKNINFAENSFKGKIKKRDLVYSWFIWMNYSHSCYSYERLMGLAFAHSMKNIFKKLYDDESKISEAIHKHTEFFNTEPNIGSPIIGYIISLEEERRLSKESSEDISYIKKGMMGISAGMGDSFTQVILAPLFISMSVMLCLDNGFYMSFIPVVFLAASILFISYTGFLNGYFNGKEFMLQRVKNVKQSKLKTYFPYMFSGILGMSMNRLLFNDLRPYESILALVVIITAAGLTLVKKRGKQ